VDDFSVDPNLPNAFGLLPHRANYVAGRKRPLSSMAPTVILHPNSSDAWLVVGASGGTTIPPSVLQVITDVIDRRKAATAAVGCARLHSQLFPEIVLTEPTFDTKMAESLRALGHNVTEQTGRLGDGQVRCVQ
jgi:gamma-glutamyltranspeptidase/glutathione hydrolase